MRILILMPVDEKWSTIGQGIYRALPQEVKDITFIMPMFADYLVQTHIAPSWEYALIDSFISGEQLYETSIKNNENFVCIGNLPSVYEFDVVFNFQDEFEEMPYEDKFLNRFTEHVGLSEQLDETERQLILKHIEFVHKADESKMPLINYAATADFITSYLQTEPKLNKIQKEYEKKKEELLKLQNSKI